MRKLLPILLIALGGSGLGINRARAAQEAPIPAAQPQVRYDGAAILELDVKTPEQLQAVEASGALILNCHPGVGRLRVVASPQQRAAVEQLGLPLRAMHDNVQALIDQERAAAARPAGDPFDDFFLDYHPYDGVGGIVWYMNELVTRYPALASVVNIGSTLEGRTIWALRISANAPGTRPGVVYFGCEHAREWIASTIPTFFATHLLANYGVDAEITDLVDNVEFYLIPVYNVDGYVYTWTTNRLWRKNRRNNGNGTFGVDINRNWGEGWGGQGSSSSGSSETYRGPSPFSEPETQVLRDFFLANPNIRAQLDIHSYSQLILWPYGYTPALPPDQATYFNIGSAMKSQIFNVHGRNYAAGPVYTAIYPASGVSVDWTYAQRDILSFSYECRDTGAFGFELPPDQIIPNNEELLPAMLHLSNADWVRAAIRFEFPNGVPSTITAGSDTTILVHLIDQFETAVPGSARMWYRYDSAGPFIESLLTSIGGNAYHALLPATNCLSTPEFYFTVDGDGGTNVVHPRTAPATGTYAAGINTGDVVFFQDQLNTNPGWTTAGQWAFGQPTGGGSSNRDPVSGFTGSNVYGYNLNGDYPNNLPATYLTTAPIDCSGRTGVQLRYRRWLGVESNSAFDEATIEASNNGVNWSVVWRATDTGAAVSDASWQLHTVDLSAVADNQSSVRLRWGMGPTDGFVTYPGWNIDDVELVAFECTPVYGDHNGDTLVEATDFEAWVNCYAASLGGPVAPGCAIFDFDADNDLACDDWAAFQNAWTGGGAPPAFGPCDGAPPPVTADGIPKNRYLSFTPGDSLGTPQAIRVTLVSNDLFPAAVGRSWWVGPPDGDNTSSLQCAPHFQVWNAATMVHAGDQPVTPGAHYAVEATLDGSVFSPSTGVNTVTRWGDCVGEFDGVQWTPPNGLTNFNDVVSAIQRFQGRPTAPPLSWVDVHDAVPNRVINFSDIQWLVQSFTGTAYPFGAPQECP